MPTAQIVRELGFSYPTVLSIRHTLQANPKTDKQTLQAHGHQFTQEGATVYTDEWQVENPDLSGVTCHSTVSCHGVPRYAPTGNGRHW